MGETIVVMFFLTVRVLIVGGFLLILPRISRKGLLFGTYVGEATTGRDAAQQILGAWTRSCLKLMGLSLAVGYGLGLAGLPIVGNLTGTVVLLIGALVLYIRIYPQARSLAGSAAELSAPISVAPLVGGEPEGKGLAKLALFICVPLSFGTLAYAIVHAVGPWFSTSFVSVVAAPAANVVMSTYFAIAAMLTADAKLSVRAGSGGSSIEAQQAFRAAYSRVLSIVAILWCFLMTAFSVVIVRVRTLGDGLFDGSHVLVVGLLAFVFLAFCIVVLVGFVKRYGQGGALMETGSVESPLTNGLADNTHWVGGLFFVDRDDPSIVVEKRFGLGYTYNYGNWKALLLVGTFLGVTIALISYAVVVVLI
jgi:hypothetical protein